MIFKPAAAFGPAVRARPQARRGAFALEPVEALPRLAERIGRLAARAIEPNPFFLPEFLEPAIQTLGRGDLRLAIFSDRDELHFFAPVLATSGPLGGRGLSVWTHPYAPLGAPLIDSEMPDAVSDGLIEHMRTSGRTVLTIPNLPLRGPAARAIFGAASRRGFSTTAARQMRPILQPGPNDDAESFERMVSMRRRRELDRQLRRLSEAGAVSFMSARSASELDAAFNMFVQLESSGWKGRRGTALQRRESIREFARIAVTQLARAGHAAIDVLRVGDKPVAALIRFDYAGLSIPWKIAYDERFAAFSPGKQLMCDETRRWLSDAFVVRVDPVCEQDNALVSALWTEREPYGTMVVSSRRLGIAARYRAGMIGLRATVRDAAKSLLRPRSASKKPKATVTKAKAGKRLRKSPRLGKR